jgi:replication-associated recombination protein RarA
VFLNTKPNGLSFSGHQINQSLNTEQTTAVKVVLDEDHGKGPYIIFGPPGTGKTLTVSLRSTLTCGTGYGYINVVQRGCMELGNNTITWVHQ